MYSLPEKHGALGDERFRLDRQAYDQDLRERLLAQSIEGERKAIEIIDRMAPCETSLNKSVDRLAEVEERLQHDMHKAKALASSCGLPEEEFPEPTGHVHTHL
jgi:hypothetical protein